MTELELHSINPDSGQITIPKAIRDEFDTRTFHVQSDGQQIVLKPANVKVDAGDL